MMVETPKKIGRVQGCTLRNLQLCARGGVEGRAVGGDGEVFYVPLSDSLIASGGGRGIRSLE